MLDTKNISTNEIQIKGFKKGSPYFVAKLLDKDTNQQLNAANCKIDFSYNEVTVTDLEGNTDTVFVTYNMEKDLHRLLEGWIP